MRRSGPAAMAAIVLTLEGLALLVIALIELFALGGGGASSLASGLALTVLTVIGAVALCAFGFGVLRGASWARSGGIVSQVLGIALALAALTIQPVPLTFVLVIGLAGVAGLVALIFTARRDGATDPRLAARERDEDDDA